MQPVSYCVVWSGFASSLIERVVFCILASLLAAPRSSKTGTVYPHLPRFYLVCGFQPVKLLSVATHHISVSDVIYGTRVIEQWSVWKLERRGEANIWRVLKQQQR